MSTQLRIGEAARAVGISAKTIRYYHEIGLMAEPARSDSDYRLYSAEDLLRLWRIRRLRALGLSLDQIRRVLDAPAPAHAATLRDVLQTLEIELNARIMELEVQRDSVRSLLARDSLESALAEPPLQAAEPYMQLLTEHLGPLLDEASPEVLEQERRMWAVLGSFQLPEGHWQHIEQIVQEMSTQPERLRALLPLAESFITLADASAESPGVEALANAYRESELFQALRRNQPDVEVDQTLEMVMMTMAMATLSPAQQRVLELLAIRPDEPNREVESIDDE